jgi:dTDP-glucose 4,6-dehydratase
MPQRTYLVTGGAGFIGSNFVPYHLSAHPEVKLINLDKLTYAGNLENLNEAKGNPNYHFVQGDICDRSLVESLFDEHDIQGVIHFAAESHVDNSISGPGAFIQTNVIGTYTLLDVARKKWMSKPFQTNEAYANARFLHISTDEVYGTLGETGLFTEETPYAPNSPYSASKASSDLIVRSYYHTFGMNVVTTNCSNNYGPKQHDEKLIPTVLRKALSKEPIPIYGKGANVRDWLYVLDHCRGIDLAFHKGKSGETYNIGGRNEWQNLKIVEKICDLLDQKRPLPDGSYRQFMTFVADRPGHDLRYAIDASKIEIQLGWAAEETFTTGIAKTVDWYLERFERREKAK